MSLGGPPPGRYLLSSLKYPTLGWGDVVGVKEKIVWRWGLAMMCPVLFLCICLLADPPLRMGSSDFLSYRLCHPRCRNSIGMRMVIIMLKGVGPWKHGALHCSGSDFNLTTVCCWLPNLEGVLGSGQWFFVRPGPPPWQWLSFLHPFYGTQGRFLGSVLGPALCIRHAMVDDRLSFVRLAGQ